MTGLKRIRESSMVADKVKRFNSLALLLVIIIGAALFQYLQLRQEYIHQLQRTVEISGEKLESIVDYEQTKLAQMADSHVLKLLEDSKYIPQIDSQSYLQLDDMAKGFVFSRVNPYVTFSQMGTLFGLRSERFVETPYLQELDRSLQAMDDLEVLQTFNRSIVETFYFSYKGFVAVKPWVDVKDLMQKNSVSSFRELYILFEGLVQQEGKGFSIHRVTNSIFSKKPVLVLSQIVQQQDVELGSYGAVLDLDLLKSEMDQNDYSGVPLYFYVGDEVLVKWMPSGDIQFPEFSFIHYPIGMSHAIMKKNLFAFDLLYLVPSNQYGIGLELNELHILKNVLPKMWVYLVLMLSVSVFAVVFEAFMFSRYYKPALIMSRLLNGEIEDKSVLEDESSELWKPIYQSIREYFDLVSISNSIPGAILQVVKAKDKYIIKYYTKGLLDLFQESEHYEIPRGTDFLRLFDTNSYWNLENLLRDSQAFMIPIAYEACLNTEKSEQTYVNVILQPRRAKDESVYWEGMLINVTDRKILELELEEEKRFIEKLFDLSGALFAVLDPDMSIVRCNQSFIQLFHQDNVLDAALSLERLFTEFDFINFTDHFNQILKGAPAGVFEHYWILPDGRKKLVKTTVAPIHNAENMVEYVVLTAIDISDRYKIEEELKKTNQNLYLKNSQVERSARIQKELFKTFEDLRDVETVEDIYNTVSKVVSQISNFHNFLVAIKPDKQHSDMRIVDFLGDFSADNYSNYFHYFRGTLGRVLMTRVPYMTGNALNDPDYILHDESVRSIIYIPITYNNFLWGILGMDSYVENAFSKMDFEILNVLGSHLGLYMEELHSRKILKEEADRLRGLHHVIQDISSLRDNDDIAQRIVENGLLKHLAIFKTRSNGDYDLIAESSPTSYELYGILPNFAILDHSLSKNKMINGRIGALNVYHLANPVLVNGKMAGILYSIKDSEFTQKDEELVLIISEQMAVFWRLNDMIERANHDALVDPLTSIWNRRYMIDRLNEENHRNNRYNSPASIVIIDLGDFKEINDKYGHNSGDEVLIEIAADFNRLIRESDFVGRYGGDEFIIYMPSTTSDQGHSLMERVITQIESRRYSQHHLPIYIDFGLATVPNDTTDIFEALKIADERMYLLKNSRKENRIK